jgi:hypothetical protein
MLRTQAGPFCATPSDFGEPDILSCYITIQDGLVYRITALEFNVVHFLRKSRGADRRKNEIVQVLHSMSLGHTDNLVFVEGGKKLLEIAASGTGSERIAGGCDWAPLVAGTRAIKKSIATQHQHLTR